MTSISQTAMNDEEQQLSTKESTVKDENALVQTFPDALLIIFIHGFKGTDETFGEFPQRLRHLLAESIENVTVECIVFPAYETKGDLNEAVIRLADWLTLLVVEREVASGKGAGSAKIVLCGHSMGGLLAADVVRDLVKSRPDKTCPVWPKIVACIALDTPYLGLHPGVVKNSVTKAAEYANAAKTVGSAILGSFAGYGANKASTPSPSPQSTNQSTQTGWARWVAPAAYAVGGAVLAGAAAGGAYYKREDIGRGYGWFFDHMKYVGNLWDEEALKQRVETMMDIQEQEGIVFRVFYALQPPVPPIFLTPRTFIVLPRRNSRAYPIFLPASNGLATDELQAHTGMFAGRTNDGYYHLGLSVAQAIQGAVASTRSTLL